MGRRGASVRRCQNKKNPKKSKKVDSRMCTVYNILCNAAKRKRLWDIWEKKESERAHGYVLCTESRLWGQVEGRKEWARRRLLFPRC